MNQFTVSSKQQTKNVTMIQLTVSATQQTQTVMIQIYQVYTPLNQSLLITKRHNIYIRIFSSTLKREKKKNFII